MRCPLRHDMMDNKDPSGRDYGRRGDLHLNMLTGKTFVCIYSSKATFVWAETTYSDPIEPENKVDN